jgi:small nuclear ribonucleoprotein (snRNP)-like protein
MEYENKFSNRKTIQDEENKADPLGFLAMSLNEGNVHVKVRGEGVSKELKGKLIAFDEHLNLMM